MYNISSLYIELYIVMYVYVSTHEAYRVYENLNHFLSLNASISIIQ